MCGRYGMTHTAAEISALFELLQTEQLEARPELCPTDPVPIVRETEEGRVLETGYRWSFVPFWWKKDLKSVPTSFNAKSEGLAEKPLFRQALKKHRCLVPASYFYEWTPVEGQKKKQRWRIERVDGAPLAFAGLWDRWRPVEGDPLRSCTVITTEANHLMSGIHRRMPVILGADGWGEWLNPETPPERLQELLRPCPDPWLTLRPD